MAGTPHALERRLGYRFNTPALLRQALTHRSAGPLHNERLEFLGDALLGLAVSERLFGHFPDADEGDLSRLRARLVRKDTLVQVARELQLGEALLLGPGEKASGGSRRDSILANAVEALLGAILLDGGPEAARACVLAWLGPRLDALAAAGDAPPDTRDAKTRLQELLQARGQALPEYSVLSMSGKPHARHFRVACRVALQEQPSLGEGSSRRTAEQAAAAAMLQRLQETA